MLSPRIAACLAATWFIWGSTYLAIKFALVSFPPFLQNGTRFLLAGSLLLLWARWRGHAMPTLVQWRNALVVGALMLAANASSTSSVARSCWQPRSKPSSGGASRRAGIEGLLTRMEPRSLRAVLTHLAHHGHSCVCVYRVPVLEKFHADFLSVPGCGLVLNRLQRRGSVRPT